jgi:SAM-dependent methyltransferase
MCNAACLAFAEKVLTPQDVQGKAVLEVGAYDVNGSMRPIIERLRPAAYLGVDIAPGRGVDELCDATCLLERYGEERFDLVVSTELIEHVEDWRTAIRNLKGVLRIGGSVLVTTRSLGFPLHGYPEDYWRYELDDMRAIFADFAVDVLEPDPSEPGVFVKARKTGEVEPTDLSSVNLHSVWAGYRVGTHTSELRRIQALTAENRRLTAEVDRLAQALSEHEVLVGESDRRREELDAARVELVHLRGRRSVRMANALGELRVAIARWPISSRRVR